MCVTDRHDMTLAVKVQLNPIIFTKHSLEFFFFFLLFLRVSFSNIFLHLKVTQHLIG